jgi:hypothetical protein
MNPKGKTMKNNVLPFTARPAATPAASSLSRVADVVRLEEYRKRSRCLRLATGVYFVPRFFPSPEDCTAA